mgnify:CR=1 FL=1
MVDGLPVVEHERGELREYDGDLRNLLAELVVQSLPRPPCPLGHLPQGADLRPGRHQVAEGDEGRHSPGDRFGVGLWVAHHLVIATKNQQAVDFGGQPGQSAGAMTSKSAGGVSAGYDFASVKEEGAGFWNETSYGRQFYRLSQMMGAGPIHVVSYRELRRLLAELGEVRERHLRAARSRDIETAERFRPVPELGLHL